MVTIFLAGEDVADMHFHHGSGNSGYGIVDGHGSVAVAAGIEDDSIIRKADLLNLVDQFAFDIALIVINLQVGERLAELGEVVLKGLRAVDIGFANAKEVEVGTVDDDNLLHDCLIIMI